MEGSETRSGNMYWRHVEYILEQAEWSIMYLLWRLVRGCIWKMG